MFRGEIWRIQLDPTVGVEIQKTRPVVILSSDAIGVLPLRVIVPLTEWKDRYEKAHWMVAIEPSQENGLAKKSAADAFQVRSVSTARFLQRMGKLAAPVVEAIVLALGLVAEYPVA